MNEGVPPATVREIPRRPWLAALLSFAIPGLGQAYAGRWRLAAILAIPMVALGLIVVGGLTGILTVVGEALFVPNVLIGILVLNGIVLAWRGFAIVDAGMTPWDAFTRPERRVAMGSVICLLALTIAMHVWVGVVVVQLDRALQQIFASDTAPVAQVPADPPSQAASPPSGTPVQHPSPTPMATPPSWDGTDRINILLLGTDAAPGRDTVLTDVVLLISADPATHTAVMISVPRDTSQLPLPDRTVYGDGLYPGRVNSIMAQASDRPAEWCPDLDAADATACGLRAVEGVIGLYLGVPIHHHALVDMAGFADVIDAIGGIDLCLPGRLVDPEFDSAIADRHADGLVLEAGCRRYDGIDALAYARSRKGWIEMPDGTIVGQSDFDRAERQQRVLLAMREEFSGADTLFELPALLGAIGRTISTDVQRGQAADLASLVPLITGLDIERVVLGYPEFVDVPSDAAVNYRLIPRREPIRETMAEIFGASELRGWYLASDAEGPEPPRAGASAAPEP